MNQTFEQYSEQKIKDFDNLKSFFPEYFMEDYNYLKEELHIADHMNDTKKALEHILQRKLNWRDVDYYSAIFMKICNADIAKSINEGKLKSPQYLQDQLDLGLLMRKRFCKMLLIEMLDENVYINLCRANLTKSKVG